MIHCPLVAFKATLSLGLRQALTLQLWLDQIDPKNDTQVLDHILAPPAESFFFLNYLVGIHHTLVE